MPKRNLITLPNDTPRNVAVNCLLAYESDRQYIQASLDTIFHRTSFSDRDRRLAGELAFGTTRFLITLDYLIARHSSRPLPRIDITLRQILRVGLYQMIYLSRTPDFAVVHEAVNQARAAGSTSTAAFVNAVLRSVQRDIDKITSDPPPRAALRLDSQNALQFKSNFLPDPAKNPARYFSLAFAHPIWLIRRWLKQFGRDTTFKICQADNCRPPLILRANRLRCTVEQLQQKLIDNHIPVERYGNALQLAGSASPMHLPGYDLGWFTVQDATAMSVAAQLAPQPGQRILDLCAAPGGKTTHLAELMDNNGIIVACDIDPGRLSLIDENARRLGITIIHTLLVDDLDNYIRETALFDSVLVDVPCSNTGVLARRVEARHLLRPGDLTALAKKQLALLQRAASAAGENAPVLYSTCSIEPVENDLLVRNFLCQNPSFTLLQEKLCLPSGYSDNLSGSSAGDLPRLPWHDGGFTALLVRK